MPRRRRAPRQRSHGRSRGKRPRAQKARGASAKSLDKVRTFALDMEEPLNDAADFVLALRLIGYGLMLHDNHDGNAIAAIAAAASERLDAAKAKWERMFKAA